MGHSVFGFLADEGGATAVEYGLIAALISVAGVTALTAVGTSLTTIWTSISTQMSNAANG